MPGFSFGPSSSIDLSKTPGGTVYECSGRGGAPVVVLIHGLGLDRHMWRDHRAALQCDYRVLTYDLFGHGDSAAPPAEPSLALWSVQLRDLLDALGIGVGALVGFSLGGMIVRRFAIDHPGRVFALAIFNSPHARSPAAQRQAEERAARTAQDGIAATLDSTLARWFTPEFRAAHPDSIEQTRRRLLANDLEIYAQCRCVLAAGVLELIDPQPPLTCPALVMTCENDSGSTPAMARAIAAEIAGAQLRIVPGLQHLGLVEAAHQFTVPLQSFLSRHAARRREVGA